MPLADRFRSRPWPWLAALALTIGNLFLHKPISDVCDALYACIGRAAYERTTLSIIAVASIAAALILLRRRLRALRGAQVALGLLTVALASFAAQQWLLVSNVEVIHFPQFALLTGLLIVAGLGPRAAW